jgi:hypothetical protein
MKRLAVLLAAALAASCGGSDTAPTQIAAPATSTETFTGTVQPPVNGQGQADAHNFTVASAGGTLTVTLTAAGPPPTITMGVGVGSPNTSGTCVLLSSTSFVSVAASTTPALQGTVATAGTYCVVVFDTGNVLQPVTYSVTVVHN